MKVYKYGGMGKGNTLIKAGEEKINVVVQGDGTIIAHNEDEERIIEESKQFKKKIIREATPQEITGVDAEAVLIEQQKVIQAYMPFMDSQIMSKLKNVPAEGLESIKQHILEVLNFYESNPVNDQPGFVMGSGETTIVEHNTDAFVGGNANTGQNESEMKDKELPEFDAITVAELKKLLEDKQITYDDKVKKPELYDLAKQIFV